MLVIKKQTVVTLSTIETEFMFATCASQAVWLKKIVEKLHIL